MSKILQDAPIAFATTSADYYALARKWRARVMQCSRFDWEAKAYASQRCNMYAFIAASTANVERTTRGLELD